MLFRNLISIFVTPNKESMPMDITINVPKNTYVQPTEVRPEVVELICRAFITGGADKNFFPRWGGNREPTLYVYPAAVGGYRFGSETWVKKYEHNYIRIRGCEMETAFKAMREAGWYMYRGYYPGGWAFYCAYSKPFKEVNYTRVESFNEFID